MEGFYHRKSVHFGLDFSLSMRPEWSGLGGDLASRGVPPALSPRELPAGRACGNRFLTPTRTATPRRGPARTTSWSP